MFMNAVGQIFSWGEGLNVSFNPLCQMEHDLPLNENICSIAPMGKYS